DGLRCEVRPAAEPRPGGPGVVFARVDLPDDPRRDVFLRILHRRHVDDEFRHPTGGYEVIVRDRDATADDSPASYRRLAEIAIMGALEYRSRPLDTRALSSWHSRHLQPGERAAERGSLSWGEPAIFDPQRQPRLHYRLDALIAELGKPRAGVAWSVQVTGGAPADDQLRSLTCTRLLDEHGEKQDPYGLGLLKRLGRSVDLSVTVGDQLVDFVELRGRLDEIVAADPAYGGYRVVLDLLVNGDGLTPMAYVRLSLEPRIAPLPDDDVAAGAARKESFEQLLRWLDAIAAGLSPETFARQGSQGAQARYDQLAARFLRKRPLDEGGGVAVAVTHLEEVGKLTRPLGADDTVAVAFRYQEPYARRFAYRVRRLSRYVSIYRRLGLWSDGAAPPPPGQALNIRLSRREPPHVPVARFLGHVVRGGLPCSEWLVEEHQEEALVQSNETLRNRLGYRGVAWSLLTEVVPSWERWSGWGGDGWSTRGPSPDDGGVPGLSSDEQVALAADAAWPEPTPVLPPDAGLAEHPFTDLLLPKGLIVRVPRLPYYYRYRLGVFARSDDVDSRVRVVDAAQVPPLRIPAVDPATAGWRIDGGDLALWWRIPSVWDSLDEIERAIWASERPFAARLWDFDLRYAIRIRRSGALRPLLSIRLVAPASGDAP
ncbi:MAG TPA: hypothetical protein VGD80_13440, partial [Kofleriaceae bacterium]